MTNITVNPKKSILITKNTKEKDLNIIYKKTKIEALDPKEACRILGCWFSAGTSTKSITQIIREEAENAIRRLQRSRITEKQAVYIINMVILARLSYRIQNIVLPKTISEAITRKYTAVV